MGVGFVGGGFYFWLCFLRCGVGFGGFGFLLGEFFDSVFVVFMVLLI